MNVIFIAESCRDSPLLIYVTFYATDFFLDHTSILICADNPVNIFLLTTIVAKRSDGTEMGENAFTCRERLLEL